jgi:chemotaxis response regulator CheB
MISQAIEKIKAQKPELIDYIPNPADDFYEMVAEVNRQIIASTGIPAEELTGTTTTAGMARLHATGWKTFEEMRLKQIALIGASKLANK